jgi:hypothetical protein
MYLRTWRLYLDATTRTYLRALKRRPRHQLQRLPCRPANGYNGLPTAGLSDSADFPAGRYLLRHLLDGTSGAMTFLKVNQQNFSAIRLNEVTPDNLIYSVVGAFGEYIRA